MRSIRNNKLIMIILWVGLFPFMLTYWGWKNKKKSAMVIGAILSVLCIIISWSGSKDTPESNKPSINKVAEDNAKEESPQDEKMTEKTSAEENKSVNSSTEEIVEEKDTVSEEDETQQGTDISNNDLFEGYRIIQVDGGDQSGHREANVAVDIGFGDREYWAFTNEYGQLVKVVAQKITLQDESTEKVLSTGRYYPDEAKVPGVESPTLDEGHVIADSLGGVSNAYNITPQNSTLNRHGDQAYMEKVIRDAGGCTDFVAVITYPNTTTQIPSHYSYTYTLKGNIIKDEFDNINPDEVNAKLETKTPTEQQTNSMDQQVMITELDKKAEYIVIKNSGSEPVDLTGWQIVSVRGNQSFTFPKFTLDSNATVKVGDSGNNPDVDFHWLDGRGTWNNSESDPAELYDSNGNLVSRFD